MSAWREIGYAKKENLEQELTHIISRFERGTIIVYESLSDWITNEPHQTRNTDNIIQYIFGTIYVSESTRDLFDRRIYTIWTHKSDDSADFEIILEKGSCSIVNEHIILYTFEKGPNKLLKHTDCICYAKVCATNNQVVYYTIMPDEHELVISDTPRVVTSNKSHTCFNVWMRTEDDKIAGELIRDAVLNSLDRDIIKHIHSIADLQSEKIDFSDRGLYEV